MTGAATVKACCAAVYQSDLARMLFGESFHPGGLRLTERLGTLLDLESSHHVLDVAAGGGATGIFLAQRFGCRVTGVDFGGANVERATAEAARAGVADRVVFRQGDAERLSFDSGVFDAVVCECAFCTFPDKRAAAHEFFRVLRPGGIVGLSDLTRTGPLPPSLDGLLAWIACIADARPVAEYAAFLTGAGFTPPYVEPHDSALAEMVRETRGKLLAAELLVKLGRIALPDVDFDQAKSLALAAEEAARNGKLGYALIAARAASGTSR